MQNAAIEAKRFKAKVALTLSDSFCVARFRDEFPDLAEHHVDILFANEARSCRLLRQRLDEALQKVRGHCEIAALTRSEKSWWPATTPIIDAVKGVKVVDTTGAGDAYAAGFLYVLYSGARPCHRRTVGWRDGGARHQRVWPAGAGRSGRSPRRCCARRASA